jgi:aspartyl-tRNA(Asn)/glutamyl-tRNA(Gln) amidotransferase subunit A
MKLNELTIKEAHAKLKAGEITAEELTQACVDRIKETEDSLHCLLAHNEEGALARAREVDTQGIQGSLSGIPATIKDILLTQGIETTAASNMLRNYIPLFNATTVQKVIDAGSSILGKNNLDAWAHGSSTENSDYGPSKNPWDTQRVPGGSSGGSAASVAADQCLYSLGSDTGGSIRQPAALCGVVGLKPTYGRVSRYGSIAMGSSLDCIGPITKTVKDAALVLNVLAGHDPLDSTTLKNDVPDYTADLEKDLGTLTVGVPKQIYDVLPDETKKSFDEALEYLKALGATIEEIDLKYLEYGIATYYIIMPSEVSSNLGRYDGVRYGYRDADAQDLHDMYYNSRSQGLGDEAKRRIMMGTYVLSAGYYDAYYKKAMKVRTLIKQEFEDFFQKYDVIATPTTLGPAFKLGEKINDPLSMYLEDLFTVTANIAGIPGISVPSGLQNGLPVGLQLLGKQFSEQRLLQIAHHFEKKVGFKKNIAV